MLPLFLWEVGRGLTTNDTSLAGIVGAVHWRVKTPQNIEVGLFLQASSTKQLHILHKRFQPFFIYIHVSFLAPVFAHYCPATRMASNIFFCFEELSATIPDPGNEKSYHIKLEVRKIIDSNNTGTGWDMWDSSPGGYPFGLSPPPSNSGKWRFIRITAKSIIILVGTGILGRGTTQDIILKKKNHLHLWPTKKPWGPKRWTGWRFQPISKILVKLDICPQIEAKIKKYLKRPPSEVFFKPKKKTNQPAKARQAVPLPQLGCPVEEVNGLFHL